MTDGNLSESPEDAITRWVKEVVDAAPPLTPHQRSVIFCAFNGTPDGTPAPPAPKEAADDKPMSLGTPEWDAYVARRVAEAPSLTSNQRGELSRIFGHATTPEDLMDSQRDAPLRLGTPEWKAHVAAQVDTWEPLDDATRVQLRLLLNNGPLPEHLLKGQAATEAEDPIAAPVPVADVKPETVAVYRHYDAEDRLLYIGISNDVVLRTRTHAVKSIWHAFAVRAEETWYDTRELALDAERLAIIAELPLFNDRHSVVPREEQVRYLVEHDRLDLLVPSKPGWRDPRLP